MEQISLTLKNELHEQRRHRKDAKRIKVMTKYHEKMKRLHENSYTMIEIINGKTYTTTILRPY